MAMTMAPKRRRNLAACDACGLFYRIDRNVHVGSARCVVAATADIFTARGWARVGSYAGLLRRAGFDVVRAPVRMIGGAYTQGARSDAEQMGDGPWGPANALAAAELLKHKFMTASRSRADTIRHMVHDQEVFDAVATIVALGGDPRSLALGESAPNASEQLPSDH